MPFVFIHILFNLNASIGYLSIALVNFFKSLFPYLFVFLIINQILIKTNLINILGYILQFICYPLFKINAKSCSLLLLSLINGFPSSVLYSSLMIRQNETVNTNIKKIATLFFLPSLTFVFYIIKNNIDSNYFNLFIISLYLPSFSSLFINRFKNNDEYINFQSIKADTIESFNNFSYIKDLKEIFSNSILNIINILGMITFYSIITLTIPIPFIKGLFEFSMPSLTLLNSTLDSSSKCFFLLIILTFSSLSSICQAAIYLGDLNIKISSFIKTRIVSLALSLSIYTIGLYVLFL